MANGNGGPPICISCGKPHVAWNGKPACIGHKSGKPDEPCTREPMTGLTVCYTHGGANPHARAKSKKARAIEALGATLGEGPTEVDPVMALLGQVAWSQTHVDWYRAQVQKLIPDALIWGETEVKDADMQGLTSVQRAETHMWLKHYNAERDRLVNYTTKAIGAGLAEREVQIAEQIGAQLNEVIRKVLADLELTPEQQDKAIQAVPRHLRSIGGSAA